VLDRLVDGLAGGGIRMRAGVTAEEVARLARAMTNKAARRLAERRLAERVAAAPFGPAPTRGVGPEQPWRRGSARDCSGSDVAVGQETPSFSAAIFVPSTRLVIFWKATSRA
jgi:hypothetical protein